MKSSQCAGEEDLSWQWNKRQMMNEPVGRMSEKSSPKERARMMSPLPITAVNQMRPKVDDSATVAHWKRLSTDDSTTSDTTKDVVVSAPPPITKTLLLLLTSMDE